MEPWYSLQPLLTVVTVWSQTQASTSASRQLCSHSAVSIARITHQVTQDCISTANLSWRLLMRLLPKQQLAGLHRLCTARNYLERSCSCLASPQQCHIQPAHLAPALPHQQQLRSSSVLAVQQPCRSHLQLASDVRRLHISRIVAVRSSTASSETDSIAAVKRLVSGQPGTVAAVA